MMKIKRFGQIHRDEDGVLIFQNFMFYPDSPEDIGANPNDPHVVYSALADFFIQKVVETSDGDNPFNTPPSLPRFDVERMVSEAINKAREAK